MLTVYLICLIVGGVFVGLSATGAIGKDVEIDHPGELGPGPDVDVHDAGHALAVADGSHGLVPHEAGARRRWLPVLSFRFWTFGSAFFGLTGMLLSTLTASSALAVALASAAVGVGVGTLSASLVRWLRAPVGESVRLADYVGCVGELVVPLREGGTTRIRLQVRERERSMLAVAAEPVELPAGTRVIVLGIDETGRAKIEPEQSIYNTEE